jgi:hypothetical protein
LTKEPKTLSEEKMASSTIDAGKTGDLHAKIEITILSLVVQNSTPSGSKFLM